MNFFVFKKNVSQIKNFDVLLLKNSEDDTSSFNDTVFMVFVRFLRSSNPSIVPVDGTIGQQQSHAIGSGLQGVGSLLAKYSPFGGSVLFQAVA
jgi:hypothetical protein